MIFTDIQSDDDGDLFIDPNANDFVISPSDQQHISDIIISFVGWWKQFSLVGVGLSSFLNSSGREQELERLISLQLLRYKREVNHCTKRNQKLTRRNTCKNGTSNTNSHWRLWSEYF